MLQVCKKLGFPIAEGKIEGPTAVIIFLGIILDTIKMELRLPMDIPEDLLLLLNQWSSPKKKKTTKRELLSLIGKLSLAAKVVPVGRIFLRGLIDHSTSVKQLHHHIHLTASARYGIKWWQAFFPRWNGVSLMLLLSRRMDQGHIVESTDLQINSVERTIRHCSGINYLGLPMVQVRQAKNPKHPAISQLCHTLSLLAAKNNFNISLQHLPGTTNSIADALSQQ